MASRNACVATLQLENSLKRTFRISAATHDADERIALIQISFL